ncbi:MAG TPA: hypothetical protein VGD54_11700 [Steroidobacteraceae bacterium]|jgi:hypothetical protein
MKLTTIALAAAFALSGTAAFASPVHHRSHTRGISQTYRTLQPDDGGPNGTAGGPTTLSGTGSSEFGGSSAGIAGYN